MYSISVFPLVVTFNWLSDDSTASHQAISISYSVVPFLTFATASFERCSQHQVMQLQIYQWMNKMFLRDVIARKSFFFFIPLSLDMVSKEIGVGAGLLSVIIHASNWHAICQDTFKPYNMHKSGSSNRRYFIHATTSVENATANQVCV